MKKVKLNKVLVTVAVATLAASQIAPTVALANETAPQEVATEATETTEADASDETVSLAEEATEATSEAQETEATTRDFTIISWGNLSYSGAAANGLTFNDGNMVGTLSLTLDIQSILNTALFDSSITVVKLPEELREIAKTDAFKKAITGKVRAWNLGIKYMDYDVKTADVYVNSADNTLVITNPRLTTILGVLPHVTVDVNINLGKAVNDSGLRIPPAANGYYQFSSALSQKDNIIDWTIGAKESTVKVPVAKMDPGYGQYRPEIYTDAVNTEVLLNSDFNPYAGVTAYDPEDGWITNKIQVVDNRVDPTREGYYTLTYVVFDSLGFKTTKQVEFHVTKYAAKGKILINPYTTGSEYISGTYTGEVDHVDLLVNGNWTSWGGNFVNGAYTYYVGNTLKTGDTVELKAYSKDNALLDSQSFKVAAKPAVGSIGASAYTVGDAYITGVYSGEVHHADLYINDQWVSWGGSFIDGRFNYFVGYGIKASDKVVLKAYSKDNQLIEEANVPVNAIQATGTISPANYTVSSDLITGTYTGPVSYAKVIVDGETYAIGGNFANGNFTFHVGANKLKETSTVVIETYTSDYQKIASSKVNVLPAPVSGTLSANDLQAGQAYVSGTYSGDVAYLRLIVNGEVISAGGNLENGRYTYFVGSNIKATDTVVLQAITKDHKYLDAVNVRVY